ncbi:PREDICTED: uncharacterized protein LOC106750523 isoform X2 [Dinoponera quadriceps]|uniref:Uncharacterized protein LOC106750523 isoform X2 n=1 Tax=Dinoponera quadriceps TaxID=609295 RepID=A0A6P3Y6A6_DINQU|nr:PREDICTED: uncharacterized protein LOC106750523 isoform X2 [Dinoponera quadriceps]
MSTRRCYLCERKANATENISLHRFPREQQLRSKWLNACNLSETDDVSKVYICSCHFKDENYRQKIALGKYVGNWLLPGAVPSVINARKMVHINDKVVQCLDIFIEDSEDISPERETISDDMNNEPATIVNVKTKCHQPSTLLKETTEPKNNENKLYVSPGENKNDDEIPDDDAGGLEEECVCTPKKRRVAEPRFVSEICVSDVATPKKAKRVIALVKQNDAKQRKKINALHRQKRDLLKRITYLRSMVKHLQQRGLMSESAGECVKDDHHPTTRNSDWMEPYI